MPTLLLLLAVCGAGPESSLPWITLSADKASFVTQPGNEAFRPWGVNYDHDQQGRLLEDYWQKEWQSVAGDFQEMKDLGANCVRIHLQFGAMMQSAKQANPAAIEQLKKLVQLAEKTGLYLNLTGLACYHKKDVPAWYDQLDEAARWNAQAAFWKAVARTCADSPAVFCYDLMNEPVIGGDDGKQGWLAGKPLGDKYFVQRIALDAGDRKRQEIAAAWVKKLCDAIRSEDKRHLITVGVIPWAHVWPNAKPVFYQEETLRHLDFVSVHFYPAAGKLDKALAALKVYDLGRPVVVEETFPLKCSIEELLEFVRRGNETADGWFSFYWGVPASEQNEKEIAGAIQAKWLRAFKKASADNTRAR